MFLFDFFYNNKLFFNCLIMGLYFLNIFAGVANRDWAHSWYWLSALSITACVTWGFSHL